MLLDLLLLLLSNAPKTSISTFWPVRIGGENRKTGNEIVSSTEFPVHNSAVHGKLLVGNSPGGGSGWYAGTQSAQSTNHTTVQPSFSSELRSLPDNNQSIFVHRTTMMVLPARPDPMVSWHLLRFHQEEARKRRRPFNLRPELSWRPRRMCGGSAKANRYNSNIISSCGFVPCTICPLFPGLQHTLSNTHPFLVDFLQVRK